MPVRVALIALLLALPALPAAAGSAGQGKAIASQHCVRCHAIPGLQLDPDLDKAPDFRTMARRSDLYTEDRLRTFLRQPHFPMKSLVLSPSDIDNLIAYIASLRP